MQHTAAVSDQVQLVILGLHAACLLRDISSVLGVTCTKVTVANAPLSPPPLLLPLLLLLLLLPL
jgi:hypothetical protein